MLCDVKEEMLGVAEACLVSLRRRSSVDACPAPDMRTWSRLVRPSDESDQEAKVE